MTEIKPPIITIDNHRYVEEHYHIETVKSLIAEVEKLTKQVDSQSEIIKRHRQAEDAQRMWFNKQARFDRDSLPYSDEEYDR